MAEIILACGRVALVDFIDHDLNQYNWCVRGRHDTPYAGRRSDSIGIYMYLVIIERMGLTIPVGMEADHEDRNSLNNHRTNLRVVTESQNTYNRNTFRNNTSGVRGVTFNTQCMKWVARINIRRQRIHLGYFTTIEEATAARLAAEKRYGV